MGLTIHYSLHSDAENPREARRHVERLHRAAGDLPFAEVNDVVELAGDEVSDEHVSGDESRRWLLVQARHFFQCDVACKLLAPLHVIAFTTWPGRGCEAANFGLCRYPEQVTLDGQTVPTRLSGWHWQSFCKTQYASDPEAGGLENFLRCHLMVVKLLDCARHWNLLADVRDEGGYWENRDVAALAREIGRWNRFVAGIVGQFKDGLPEDFIAPITNFPNFEHLEAEWQNDAPDDASPP